MAKENKYMSLTISSSVVDREKHIVQMFQPKLHNAHLVNDIIGG